MSRGVDGSGRKLRTLQRSGRWWLEHLEWMPARLHGTGWKLRTTIDLEGEAGRQVTHEKMRREGIAVHIANLPELVGKPSDVGSTISNRQAEQMTQPSPRMLSVLRDRG